MTQEELINAINELRDYIARSWAHARDHAIIQLERAIRHYQDTYGEAP